MGDEVRAVLEATLARHSVLSVGDWVSVEHGGSTYDLRVQQLRPAPAVSVIGALLMCRVMSLAERYGICCPPLAHTSMILLRCLSDAISSQGEEKDIMIQVALHMLISRPLLES